ncbi:hypothetical protein DL93DRAFT_2165682 [Clavulina sp. PMI_390]|nr:hypothetical protein DL93DRAFT_2165682 [Clavulina sp. PMI_390]
MLGLSYNFFVSVGLASLVLAVPRRAAPPSENPNLQRRTNPIPYSSIQLSSGTIQLVDDVLATAATHSWEIGTRETALLELWSPNYFLYSLGSSIPPPALTNSWDIDSIAECFGSVDSVLATRPAGIQTFFQDSAVGDPASVGIPFLIKNATMASPSASSNYSIVTQQELDHLLAVPRENLTGAISQREPPEPLQIWADFVAMAPPFIAYYGAIHNNQSLLQLAYDQVAAYRTLLLDTDVGLLKHIVLGGGTGSPPQDPGHWSTGNAWFVTGLLRVERTIFLSSFRSAMAAQRASLLEWALELTDAAWSYQNSTGFIYNYIDCVALGQSNSTTCFEDSAGTALLAAGTFRLAQILHSSSRSPYSFMATTRSPNVWAAEQARQYIVNHVDTTTGILGPIVNPLDWSSQLQAGGTSPEGQAFVLMLQAAYRDWWSLTGGYY